MKYLLLCVILALCVGCGSSSKDSDTQTDSTQKAENAPKPMQYQLSGKLDSLSQDLKVYLIRKEDGELIDSTEVKKGSGSFSFKAGTVPYPQIHKVIFKNSRNRTVLIRSIWLEDSKAQITGSWLATDSLSITGGKSQTLEQAFDKEAEKIVLKTRNELKDTNLNMFALEKLLAKTITKKYFAYIAKQTNTYWGIQRLFESRTFTDKPNLKKTLGSFDKKFLNTPAAKSIQYYLDHPALDRDNPRLLDFSIDAIDGNGKLVISEETRKGKPVLLIFQNLATISKGNREALEEFYKEYKDKAIIGVIVTDKYASKQSAQCNLNVPIYGDSRGIHSPVRVQNQISDSQTSVFDASGKYVYTHDYFDDRATDALKKLLKDKK